MARLKALPLRPAWMKLIAALAALSMLGVLWPPLAWLLLPLALAIGATLAKAGWRSFNAYRHTRYWLGTFERARRIVLTTLVLVIEPVARAYGRAVFLIGRGAG